MDGFVSALRGSLGSKEVLGTLQKPLRPMWLTTAGLSDDEATAAAVQDVDSASKLPFAPVMCVSASEPVDRQVLATVQ